MVRSEPSVSAEARIFDCHGLLLFSIAYRMLGSDPPAVDNGRKDDCAEVDEFGRLAAASRGDGARSGTKPPGEGLRAGRKTRGSRVSLLAWELRRIAGILRKFSRTVKKPRKGVRS